MIPILMRMKIAERGRKKVNLYFPIILLWIVVLALLTVLLPFILLVALFLWPQGYGKIPLAVYAMLFSLIFSLSGLHIQVEDKKNQILIILK